MLKLLNLFVIIGFLSLIQGCSESDGSNTSRDYRIFVKSSDPAVLDQFRLLIQDFNQSVGLQILNFETNPEDSTSPLALVSGLRNSTGKLGFGGVTYQSTGAGLQRERTASMQIELDMDYVRSRLPSNRGSIAYEDLRLLFFHEVGHGLGFSHAGNQGDVMYQDLNGTKDFLGFYNRVANIYE